MRTPRAGKAAKRQSGRGRSPKSLPGAARWVYLAAAVKRGPLQSIAGTIVSCALLVAPRAAAQTEGDDTASSAEAGADPSAEQLDPEATKTDKSTRSSDQFEADLEQGEPEGPPPEAQAEAPADAAAAAQSDDESAYGHGFQFGIRGGLVGGYRMVFRYDDSPFCKAPEPVAFDDQQKFCGHAAPLAIDVGVSFAPLDGVEPFLWARFGLAGEGETNTNPITFVGAGVRLYTMSDSAFKIFIEPAIGAELEGGGDDPAFVNPANEPFDYKKDIVFHIAAGPQFDFARYVGAYANAGISLGILRAIHSSLELQAGIQTRFP